jgi:hypothetical protein
MGRLARSRVLRDYVWDAQLARFGELLEGAPAARQSMAG